MLGESGGDAIEHGSQTPDLLTLLVELGSEMAATGQPVYVVQDRITAVARAHGAESATVTAFPTYLMVSIGRGEPAAVQLTPALGGTPRLDQIASLDHLLDDAEAGVVTPAEGLRRLAEIRAMPARWGPLHRVVGYAILAMGICLVLHPAPLEVAAAAVLGALVGILRSAFRGQQTLQMLTPVTAAFLVSALSAWAVQAEISQLGLRPMVAALVVFLPGAALTTAVLELAAGQMISGASRLVSGGVQLALLAFGILAGIESVGISPSRVLFSDEALLGAWSPWVGVFVFAVGVVLSDSAPRRSLTGLLIVLYAAWGAQVLSNALAGGYVGALLGATVMTMMAFIVERLPSAMPAHAAFLPGFWLLVPGALGLMGLTRFAGGGSAQDLFVTVGSLFAVALGVLFGTQLLAWAVASRRLVGRVTGTIARWRPFVG
ncbi:MAG TPA: threonine/serine exporter family protein [Acidimicrobiia bacterium]|nr:threonine/serine exporter family protein [Acidimicrobiia bacterium]